MQKRVNVEYNPEYGVNYGEGEIKDTNDYYSNEDIEPEKHEIIQFDIMNLFYMY